MSYASGRHFLQIPGPTNVPDRVLRAMAAPTIDHRGPEFGALAREVLAALKPIFKTRNPVIIYPASGTGAWEAALVNTLSLGDEEDAPGVCGMPTKPRVVHVGSVRAIVEPLRVPRFVQGGELGDHGEDRGDVIWRGGAEGHLEGKR